MRHIAALFVLFPLAMTSPAQEQTELENEVVTQAFGFTLLPSLWPDARQQVTKNVSVNLLAGTTSRLHGLELGVLANIVSDDVRGLQLSALANGVGDDASGGQLAGITNVVVGDVHGIQLAGIANVVGGSVSGAQRAGIANVVRDSAGYQMAGIVNVARHAAKIQLAPINLSDTNDGIPIGFLSLVGDNPLRTRVWADEAGFISFGLKSGTPRFYNMFVVAAQPEQLRKPFRWAVGGGAGWQMQKTPLILSISDYILHINEDELWTNGHNVLNKLRATVGYRFGSRFAIVGGASWNVFLSQVNDGSSLAPWTVYANDATTVDAQGNYDDTSVTMWPGFFIGLEF